MQLNAAKTEVLWCLSTRRQHQTPSFPLTIGSNDVIPVNTVHDLGIYDSDISMRTHFAKTVSSCFDALRQVRSIKRSVSRPVLQSLVVSMVLTRLDYGSETLAGLPRHLMEWLQSVINAAARFVFFARKYDHIAAQWTSMVKLSGANIIQPGGVCLSMPAQFSAVVSFARNSPCVWRRLYTTAAISIDGDSNRSSLEVQHLAGRRHICAVIAALQMETELFKHCYTFIRFQ